MKERSLYLKNFVNSWRILLGMWTGNSWKKLALEEERSSQDLIEKLGLDMHWVDGKGRK